MFRVIDQDRTFHGEFETRDQADETLADLFENDPGAPDGFYWIETSDETATAAKRD
jgi:hypothetical protein